MALARVTRDKEPLEIAYRLDTLGGRFVDFDRLAEAEGAFNEALKIAEPLLNADDPNLAGMLTNLGEVYLKTQAFAKAELVNLRAAEIAKSAHGEESAVYGTMLGNLGTLYDNWAEKPGQAQRRVQAERFKTQAFAITRATRGARHHSTANIHHSIAIMLMRRCKWPDATAHAERAVAIMLSLDLWEHPRTQLLANDLAHFWERSGQPEKAVRLQANKYADFSAVIADIEIEHRIWIANDPKTRHFGPPSPFAQSKNIIRRIDALADAAGLSHQAFVEKIETGEIDEAAFEALKAKLNPS